MIFPLTKRKKEKLVEFTLGKKKIQNVRSKFEEKILQEKKLIGLLILFYLIRKEEKQF